MAETINTATPDYIVDGVLTDGEAWVPLKTTILGSDTVGVTWTSSTGANDWSQYMDLIVIGYSQSTTTANGVIMQFNNDTTVANYEYQDFYSSGSAYAQGSGTTKGFYLLWSDKHATQNNTYAAGIGRIYDINSGKYKMGIQRFADSRSASGYVGTEVSCWTKQEAISEIDLIDYNGNAFAAGSRYDLFGVLPRMVTA